jgi:hypothetical protein
MRELERRVVLQVLDRRWRDHLYEMDYLKDGIGLRAMAQRDPLIEYQREGYEMFQAMMGQIKEESVGFLYNLEVEVRQSGEEVEARACRSRPRSRTRSSSTRRQRRGEVEVRNDRGQVQQAATSKLRQQRARRAAAPAAEAPRGAFGQRTDAAASAPAANNRAERRAAGKKSRRRRPGHRSAIGPSGRRYPDPMTPASSTSHPSSRTSSTRSVEPPWSRPTGSRPTATASSSSTPATPPSSVSRRRTRSSAT